jgi:hypothetical protein
MMQRFLNEEKAAGNLHDDVDTIQVTEMIFSGILGACVMYTSDKSTVNLDRTINALINHLDMITKYE